MNFKNISASDFFEDMEENGGARSVKRYKNTITNTSYFVKNDPNGEEFLRLKSLSEGSLPTPKEAYYLEDTECLATRDEGIPLNIAIKENRKVFYSAIMKVSDLIEKFNQNMQGIDESLICNDNSHTSHPIKNFTSRFIEMKSDASNRFLLSNSQDLRNIDMDEHSKRSFINLYYYVKTIIDSYYNRINNIKDDAYEDNEVVFGDMKPENILMNSRGELSLIDPFFVKGDKYFDFTKFTSRLLLEGVTPSRAIDFLSLNGNGELKKIIYRGLSERELINIDMANILSSYIGRFLDGNSDYRLVKNLSNNRITDLWRKSLNEGKYKEIFID